MRRTATTPVVLPSEQSKHPFKKQRPVNFKVRLTQFDLSNPDTSNDTFRGFYTLFWIAMGFYIIQSLVRCYEQEGILLGLGFFRLLSKDGWILLISDLLMVIASLVWSVFYAKMILLQYLPHNHYIQWAIQFSFLAISIAWTFYRQWPWVQSGFFTMHTIVMMMKMHSYISLNGDLAIKYRRYRQLKASDDEKHEEELDFLRSELVHGKTRYPNNISISNYLDYLMIPSLVYWMEYPRTEKIRVWYVFEKAIATLGSFLMLYVTTERYILPKLYNPDMSEPRVILELLFPFMLNYLFIFYIIFECILNAFAELSKFADRNFYDDWWNSVSYDEFARKWNKPVHQWLLRHVYAQSIDSFQLSKANAIFVTFLTSSIFHELVLIIVTKKFRLYMFVIQMLQLPMMMMGRLPFFRQRFWLGNLLFWLSMFLGPPLIGILYCREAFWAVRS
ncbi:MBOAT, membrane-bound O-acyltransferase family-domain-containing protein [Pilobolus umbonatus]|nr:MBOAT, membrane-bound O-acyltransferase family-domain-containing protein [Pilobolus umbonatus]